MRRGENTRNAGPRTQWLKKGRGSTVASDVMTLKKGLDGAGGWIRQVVLSTGSIRFPADLPCDFLRTKKVRFKKSALAL